MTKLENTNHQRTMHAKTFKLQLLNMSTFCSLLVLAASVQGEYDTLEIS